MSKLENLKWRRNGAHLRDASDYGSSVERFEFFFMALMLILNLAHFGQYLVDLGWYMDAYMVHVSVHGSWLILHGSFSSQFLQGLDDYCASSMVIGRSAGCFKCHF